MSRRVFFLDASALFHRYVPPGKDYELSPPRRGNRLSSHDALILSMASEYRREHPTDSMAIVTEDRRIVDFCLAFRDYPHGVRISTQNAV